MVKKRAGADRLSGKIPAPLAVRYPESEFSRLQRAKIVEVDVAQSQHEEVWGIGRVTTLVPTEFRVKFYAQSERIWSAQEAQDEQKFVAACDGMVRAYKAMSSWAQAEGLPDVVARLDGLARQGLAEPASDVLRDHSQTGQAL